MVNEKNKKIILSVITIIILAILLIIFWPKKPLVTFEVDGVKYLSIRYNHEIEEPTPPKKEGYTFEGWYNGDEKFDFNSEVSEDVTLTPKWSVNEYTITFDDGVNDQTIIKAEYGTTIELPEAANKPSYAFIGWFNDDVEFTTESIVTEDLILNARYAKNYTTYKVESYLMGKNKEYPSKPTYVDTYNVHIGDTITVEAKSHRGYTTPTTQTIIIDSEEKIVKYYYEIVEYTLTVETDEGVASATGDGTYFYGDTIEINYNLKPGYVFDGYSEKVDGKTYTMPDEDVTIKVSSKPNSKTEYHVNHYLMDLDGKNYTLVDTDTYYGTTDTSVTPEVKTYEGFTSPSTVTIIIDGDGTSEVNYHYTRNKYTLTMETSTGISAVTGDGTYYYEEEIELGYTLQPGYTFTAYSEFAHGNVYTMPAKDVNLTAYAKPNNDTKYQVKYYLMDLDGKNYTLVDTDTYYGITDTSVTPEVKTYEGFTSPSTVTINIDGDGTSEVNYRYTRNKYNLTIKPGIGISDVTGEGTYYYEEEIELGYTLKPGYTFKEYSEVTEDNVYTMPAKDVNLTAYATPNTDTKYQVNHYLMTFDGSYLLNEREELTGTTDTSVTPTVKTYTGFTSPNSVTVNINGDGTTIVNYLYTRNQYTLTLKGGEGIKKLNGSGTYYYGQHIPVSAELADGYAFVNWSNGETNTAFHYEMQAESVEITASAKPIIYNIKYILNGGIATNPITYIVTDTFTLNTPIREGYTFKGWLVNGNESDGTIQKGTTGDLTIEAIFEPNSDTPYTVEYYFMDVTGQEFVKSSEKTENLTGTTDAAIKHTPEIVAGFETPILKDRNDNEVDIDDLTITSDGKTVLKYYYVRKQYTLTVSYTNSLDKKDREGVQSISQTNTYYYGTKVNIHIKLEKGFELVNWSNDEKETNFEYEITAQENQTLVATIKRTSYKVDFDSKGGSNVDSAEILFGKLVEKPKDPTRTGHDFDGWYYQDGSEEKKWNFEKDTMPASNITIYAKWKIHKKTVTFDANDGKFNDGKSNHDLANQNFGSQITQPEQPTRVGYKFVDWYYKANGTEKKWDFTKDTMPDDSLTLYAKWTPITYKVQFNGNTSTTGEMSEITCTYDQDCILTNNAFAKEYKVKYSFQDNRTSDSTQTVQYSFKGWKVNNETFADGASVKNLTDQENAIVILNAQWKLNSETATLASASRTGYQFGGWFNGNNQVTELNNISQNLDLTAHWEANKYKVKYDSNKGNGSTNPSGEVKETEHTYDSKTELNKNKFNREGYTFVGWSTTKHNDSITTCEDCITEANNLTSSNNAEVTVYAVWKANNYTIEYVGNGSTTGDMTKTITTCTFDKDCQLSKNDFVKEYNVTYNYNNPEKTSSSSQTVKYQFKNWKYNDETFIDGTTVKNLTTINNGKVTLTAQWEIDTKTTVLKSATRTGYQFDGWYNGTNQVTKLDNISQNLDLTANWEANKYTVKYDSNKGNGSTTPSGTVSTTEHKYDDQTTLSTDKFTREGYTFLGWSTKKNEEAAKECTNCIDKASNLTSENNGEVTVYAVWKANEYTVRYEGNGNTAGVMNETTICTFDEDCRLATNSFIKEYNVTYDETNSSVKVSNPQKVKYEFQYWSYNGNHYNNESKVKNLTTEENGKVTLTAQWKVNSNTTELKADPTRTGYNFSGWYNETNTKVDSLDNISEDMTLSAQWKPITYKVIFDGNGGKNNKGETKEEIDVTYDDKSKALSTFTKSYTITYDEGNAKNSESHHNVIFNGWKLNDTKTIKAGEALGNLATKEGEEIILTAQWTDPEVTINKEGSKEAEENYFTYDFEDWYDGDEKYYKLNDKFTLTQDITLTAEYTKIINPNIYIKEKMITSSRSDFTTSVVNNNYTIDIVDVNGNIIVDTDIAKIEEILSHDDITNVILKSDKISVTIESGKDVESKVKEFLSKITGATVEKVATEKHLSSLFKRSISVTVNLDGKEAHTIDNKTNITYNLNYTNTNKHIVTQEDLYSISQKGLDEVNNAGNHHFKATRDGQIISAQYNPRDKEINVMCLFAKSASGMNFCNTNTAESKYTLSGATGMNNAVKVFFSDDRINDIVIENESKSISKNLDKDYALSMASDNIKLANFASDIVGVLNVSSKYTCQGLVECLASAAFPKVIKLKGVYPPMLTGNSFFISVNLADGYVFEDNVDNKYKIQVIEPVDTVWGS